MKIFNSKSATEEYMSTHSLTFSTPDMTLKKFALWLSEYVEFKGEQVPRIVLFLETREEGERNEEQQDNNDSDKRNYSDFLPDVDETFRPTGAVTDMFSKSDSESSSSTIRDLKSNKQDLTSATNIGSRFCIECGSSLKHGSKFCIKCGTKQ